LARERFRLPRSFTDRAVREALLEPHNLRALLRDRAPEVADDLDYDHPEVLPPLFPLDDWRQRDKDVLVRLRFRDPAKGRDVLVCILVEHQSAEDPAMPLRLLVYAVLWWEREWKRWEEGHERGEPLRLTPVIPVVLHTGEERWETSRSLADLFDVPAVLQPWLPQWRMPLCDLPEHTATELLQRPEPLWQVLAVARAQWAPAEEFEAVLREAFRRLEPLGTEQSVYWHQLVQLIFHWACFRRSPAERQRILELARASHSNVQLAQEVQNMGKQLEKTWEEELTEKFLQLQREAEEAEKRGEERGIKLGEERGIKLGEERARVAERRATLRQILAKRFGALPEGLLQRIEAADLQALQAAIDQALDIKAPDELQL
jgi:hypothetical protein